AALNAASFWSLHFSCGKAQGFCFAAALAACLPSLCGAAKSPGPCGSGLLVPVVGVEPTRVISTRDFESPSSAIPTHRLIFYVIIAYLARKIKRKVSLSFRRAARRRPAAQTGAPGGGLAPWAGRAAGALAASLMGLFLDGARHLFSNKTLQMTRNFILYK